MKKYNAKMQKVKEDIMFYTVITLAGIGVGALVGAFVTLWSFIFYI